MVVFAELVVLGRAPAMAAASLAAADTVPTVGELTALARTRAPELVRTTSGSSKSNAPTPCVLDGWAREDR